MFVAACLGCVHTGGAASGLQALEASELGLSGSKGAQCWVVPSHSRS